MENISEIKTELYQSILDMIITKTISPFEDWKSKPFSWDGKSCATNGWSIVVTPKIADFPDQSKKLHSILPFDPVIKVKLNVSELKEKMKTVPMSDCYDEVRQECKACDGSGEVDFIFEYDREEYIENSSCPVCDGDGVSLGHSKLPNGEKVINYDYSATIGRSHFNLARIEEMLAIADLVKAEEITILRQQEPVLPSYFQISEVLFVLMPIQITDKELIAFTISNY